MRSPLLLIAIAFPKIITIKCDRLSEIERQVISLLAKENHRVNLVKLLENSRINSSDLINALQSLLKRCLIEQQGNFYTVLPLLKQYIESLNGV